MVTSKETRRNVKGGTREDFFFFFTYHISKHFVFYVFFLFGSFSKIMKSMSLFGVLTTWVPPYLNITVKICFMMPSGAV